MGKLDGNVAVITGGASTPSCKAFLAEPSVRWLLKPFRAAELLARVDEVLATAPIPA